MAHFSKHFSCKKKYSTQIGSCCYLASTNIPLKQKNERANIFVICHFFFQRTFIYLSVLLCFCLFFPISLFLSHPVAGIKCQPQLIYKLKQSNSVQIKCEFLFYLSLFDQKKKQRRDRVNEAHHN